MKVLILIAHGSRVDSANSEIKGLAKALSHKAQASYTQVVPAFLELAEPSIPDAMQQCIDEGADELVLLPYFLAGGKHIRKDIPSEIGAKQAQYPDIKISVLDYFGKSQDIADILLRQAGC